MLIGQRDREGAEELSGVCSHEGTDSIWWEHAVNFF
jgi:hypothetical protein